MYQLALLWEAAFPFSECFLKTLSTHLPISWWVTNKHTCPHCTECTAVFDPNWCDPCAPPFPFSRCRSKQLIIVPQDEKSPQGERVSRCGRDDKKMAEALKGIKSNEFKNCFEQWKKHLDSCIASNGEYFEGDSFKHVRISIHFFISNFWYFWNPPLYIKTLCWALILQSY